MDKFFRVKTLAATERPQQVIYAAMHQDSSSFWVGEDSQFPAEDKCGEIVVKRLLDGGRGHYGCYSADTEVLTDRGWMFWPDFHAEAKKADCGTGSLPKLLAVNTEDGFCSFEAPSAIQAVSLASGDSLYTVESQYLNFSVTGDHRMVVSHRQKSGGFSPWYIKTAQEVVGKPVRYLISSCLSDDDRSLPSYPAHGIDTPDAFRLAGFFFGDGLRTSNKNPVSIRFKIRRPRKIAYLMSLGFPLERKKGDRYVIRNEFLAAWIHEHFSSKEGKTIPHWILTLPKLELAAFWDGLKNSDGTNIKGNTWCYDSSDKKALDLIQATAHINGFSANMTLNNPNEGEGHENHRPCWRIQISEKSTRRVETCQNGRSTGVKESWTRPNNSTVYCATVSTGALMIRRNNKVIVLGNCLEHPQITFAVGYFPHSVMQQARTHRVGVTFDCQSMRYTSKLFLDIAQDSSLDPERAFYLRPVGEYTDRQGKKYFYSEDLRMGDLACCIFAAKDYSAKLEAGMSEEHARGMLPFDYRQHFVVSFNLRSLMHFLDLRAKKDAQLEIQWLCDLLMIEFQNWAPEIASWYKANRLGKARLAP